MSATPDETSPWAEADRLQALRAYGVLDSEREPAFDDIVDLVARMFDAPASAISLIDGERHWFKAETGLGMREIPAAPLPDVLLSHERLLIPDAAEDARLVGHPLFSGELRLRFYAGELLRTREGLPIGVLAVFDTEPRPEPPSSLQLDTLRILARQVMAKLELRRSLRLQGESQAQLRAIADSMPQMVWSTRADGFHDYYNARWYEFTGVPSGTTDGEGWKGMFHPEDQERASERWRHSLATGEIYEIEYRLRRHDGVYRWTLGRAMPVRGEDGQIVRWFGTCTDIDDLKRMEQAKELLSQELSHRIKNIFAVVSALIALSARRFPEAKAFSAAVRTRINALARAHEFVRPHTESSRPTVGSMTLHAFLADLFKAYSDPDGGARGRLSGDDASFDDQAATSVALLFHELATNAAKYGALSAEDGHVELVTRREDDRFILEWSEHGGPPVDGEPVRSGFGSSLATLSVEGQLGGRLTRAWEPEGLRVVAELPATALSRRRAALSVAVPTPA